MDSVNQGTKEPIGEEQYRLIPPDKSMDNKKSRSHMVSHNMCNTFPNT